MNLREGVLKDDEELARLVDAFRTVHDKMYGYTPDSPGQMATGDEFGGLVLRFEEGPGNTSMG